MRKELEERLTKRFPTWFSVNGDARHTQMPFGFQCGDGWFEILWRLCADLEPMVTKLEKKTGTRFAVVQVKEQLGTLCFIVSHHSDAVNESIVAAQMESSRTCEICGQPGKWREGSGWVRVRCDGHEYRAE
jgi:hypothetical protein